MYAFGIFKIVGEADTTLIHSSLLLLHLQKTAAPLMRCGDFIYLFTSCIAKHSKTSNSLMSL